MSNPVYAVLRRGRLVFALRVEQHSPSEPSDFHRPRAGEAQGLLYWHEGALYEGNRTLKLSLSRCGVPAKNPSLFRKTISV
jgi:hypothetical protein